MNDPVTLTAIGLILFAAVIVAAYLTRGKWKPLMDQWTQKFRGDSAAPSAAGDEPWIDPERRHIGGILVFLGFVLGFLGNHLRQDLPPENASAHLPFLAIGLLFFSGGMYLASHLDQKVFFLPALDWIAAKLSIRPIQVLCLAGGIFLAMLATVAAGTDSLMISPAVAILSWIGGIALTVLGGWAFTPASGRKPFPGEALAWAAGLTLAAFLLRAVMVGQIPVMLTGDEGSTGIDALQFREGAVNNPFGIFGWHPFPSLYFFIESIGIALFGRTVEALRYPSALAGALTVGGLYLLVRAMYSHRHALAAAVFLSALHLHMHFSRLGVMNTWDGLWYLITLGGLWYGWHSGKRAYWILAALAMGIGQYFYATTRTLFVAVPLWLLAATFLDRGGWKRNLSNILPALAALTAVLLPLAWYVATHMDQYLADIKTNSILGPWMELTMREQGLPAWRILLKQLGLGFGGYFMVNLSFWYRPDVPILRTLPAVFFLFGLVILLLRLKEPRTWIPLWWLAAYGMIVSLSESAPAAQRLPGVGAAVALVVGVGAVEFASIFSNLFPARKWALGIAAVALVGYMALDDLRFYFGEYTPNSVYMGRYDFVGEGGEVAKQLILQLRERPGEWQVVFLNNHLMGFYSNPALRYLAPNAAGMDLNETWGSPANPPIPEGNVFLVIMPGREEEIPLIQADYPGGTPGEIRAEDGSLLYSYYEYRPDR
ncbi:MAG: glycosyltransferase family 39 protein [Anaerolineales bacterium]|nr:glycosyltransferase family 39 protein [Anaerolineales bacterium]